MVITNPEKSDYGIKKLNIMHNLIYFKSKTVLFSIIAAIFGGSSREAVMSSVGSNVTPDFFWHYTQPSSRLPVQHKNHRIHET